MERLTYEKSRSRWNEGRCPTKYTSRHTFQEVVARLAAYEDTGLTPEEIETQRIALAQCKPYVDAICDEQGKVLINPIHLAELAQAEKDGRLVVLPCKPDATAYQWKTGGDVPSLFRLDGVTINEDGEIAYQTHWGETFKPDDFGKTVFLTREEAEAALKKREGYNEAVR